MITFNLLGQKFILYIVYGDLFFTGLFHMVVSLSSEVMKERFEIKFKMNEV